MDDVFEDEIEHTVSIHEFLKDVEQQELEADLVLGGDEGKECTYANGYLKRQAVFSCITCTPDGTAGVCTACSLACHDGHEVVELWTKRNFRCDCGNSKFGEFFCKLLANKDVENIENSYNHNFKGLYCTCGRPNPDLDIEEDEQVEMIQCCFCEDWFHEQHLGLVSSDEVPRDEEGLSTAYEDFMCKSCSAICSFLFLYPQIIWTAVKQHDVTDMIDNKKLFKDMSDKDHPLINGNFENTSASNGVALTENTEKNDAISSGACVLGADVTVASPKLESTKPIFLIKNWRDILCRCDKCMNFYNQKHISFLLDKEDSVVEYEKMAKQKREEQLQQQEGVELNFLNNLGHVEKLEILSGIVDMKNELQTFMESFDSSKTVTSEDVQQVFENLAKKRRRAG